MTGASMRLMRSSGRWVAVVALVAVVASTLAASGWFVLRQWSAPDPFSASIESYVPVGSDQLRVEYLGGVTTSFADAAVVETTTTVTVRVRIVGDGRDAPAVGIVSDLVVNLDAPLGNRQVLDDLGNPVRLGRSQVDQVRLA